MRAWPASAIGSVSTILLVLLAGCSGGGPEEEPFEPTSPAPPEEDNAVLYVAFQANGTATLEVPFPHLDACMAPEDWMAGNVSVAGGTATVRDASEGRLGRVLAITGDGQVSWSSQVALKPACQTLRYDPWSVDPDPADGTVEVRAAEGTPLSPSVLVRWVRDNCGNATLYEGEASGTGWSALEGRSTPAASC